MRQLSFATQPSFEKYACKSRREEFLTTMEAVIPWSELEARIAPHYPKAGKGRQPVGLGVMLRIYFLQHWFALSDPGAEDALYESPVLRGFCGIDLGRAPVPDETTILNFRHLLEAKDLCGAMLEVVNHYLSVLEGVAHRHRHDRGCHDHRRAEFDQERQQGAGSADASDQEGEPVLLRREGAHRGGLEIWRGAFGVHVGSFRA
jgi:hypothetical protein